MGARKETMKLLSLAALSLLTVASGQSPQCGYACNDLTPGWDCDSTPNCNVCWGQVCVSQAVADAANANASLVHKERPLAASMLTVASGQSLRGQGSPVCNGTQTPFCTDHFFHHPTNNCTTSSQLSPGDCEAWVDIWDGLNGPDWGYAKEGGTGGCSDERYRLDPCACTFQNSEFMNGVIFETAVSPKFCFRGTTLKDPCGLRWRISLRSWVSSLIRRTKSAVHFLRSISTRFTQGSADGMAGVQHSVGVTWVLLKIGPITS